MGRPFQHKEHLVRVAGLFAAGIVIFLIVQAVLVPKGFGLYGHFRAGAVADNENRPLVFAGRGACAECHSDAADALKGGKHAGVGCEACHGPLERHTEDASAQKAEPLDPRNLCLRCHTANVAKPRGFPQVEPSEHSPTGACTECHTAHAPSLGEEGKR